MKELDSKKAPLRRFNCLKENKSRRMKQSKEKER